MLVGTSNPQLFDDWFDPIEAAARDRAREFIEELIRSELALLSTLEGIEDVRRQLEASSSVSLTCFGGVSSDLPHRALQVLHQHGTAPITTCCHRIRSLCL